MKKMDQQRGNSRQWNLLTVAVLTAFLLMGSFSQAMAQTRIVVLPFYTEKGKDAKDSYNATHYRRMMRFINNQLVRHGFEVINPFAADSNEREYNRVLQRTREDSPLASMEMCKKYGTDAAYVVWLTINTEKTGDGYCKASGRLDGEGYDSAGHDLGVGLSKTFNVTRRDCDDAIAEVEKEVGDIVGRTLTAWNDTSSSHQQIVTPATLPKANQVSGNGALQKNINKFEKTINLRLDGATQYEHAEIFGKVVNTVTGIVEAKRYRSRITPNNPQASYVTWRVQIEGTDTFRLQANITKMIHDILDAPQGEIRIKGVPYRYTAAELDMLKGFRPGDASAGDVQFVIDRELSRDRDLSGRHDPYQARGQEKGFE